MPGRAKNPPGVVFCFNFARMDKTNVAKLNDKQQAFVREYLIDRNATQAAIRAGYSEKTAQEQSSRLLSNVIIRAEIDAANQKAEERTEITFDYVLNNFKTIAERCMQREPVYGSDGKPTGEWRFDAAGANRATELMGKLLGHFEKDNRQKAEDKPTAVKIEIVHVPKP